jgi:hypothetical protein
MTHPQPGSLPPPFPLPASMSWAPTVTDPGPSCDDACRARHARALELVEAPHPDDEARRWLRANDQLTELIFRWNDPRSYDPDALAVWFVDRPMQFRFPAEPLILLEWMVLGFRATAEDKTLAERRLPKERWRSADLRALARAVVGAPPALLRVIEAEPEWGLGLQPVCPPGDPVRVPDRASACLVHPGGMVGGRLLPAGSWHLLRPVGPFVEPARVPALLRQLDEILRFHRVPRSSPLAAMHREAEFVTHLLAQFALPEGALPPM